MYGLGIYFADLSSKSDGYVTDKSGTKGVKTGRKMLVVEVMLGECYECKPLNTLDEFHDHIEPPNGKDSIMAIGMKTQATKGFEVIDNECACFTHELLPQFPPILCFLLCSMFKAID